LAEARHDPVIQHREISAVLVAWHSGTYGWQM
jgi:hypothetical protein